MRGHRGSSRQVKRKLGSRTHWLTEKDEQMEQARREAEAQAPGRVGGQEGAVSRQAILYEEGEGEG
jgi:hypothetical protein